MEGLKITMSHLMESSGKNALWTCLQDEIGVASAVLNFNDGFSGVLNILNSLKIKPGKLTTEFCGKLDSQCVTGMDLKSSDQPMLWRKQLRAQRKEFTDTVEQKESLVYEAEEF